MKELPCERRVRNSRIEGSKQQTVNSKQPDNPR
jgi:hypothetical protein